MKPRIAVKRYKTQQEYQSDARRALHSGYEVMSVVSEQPRTGCMRIILLGGIGALIWKPKPVLIVTYRLAGRLSA